MLACALRNPGSIASFAAEPSPSRPHDISQVANANNGLARGLHEAVRALESGKALLCVLADSLDQPDYERLIKALCTEKNVNLLSVSEKTQLGEWAGVSQGHV